MLHHLTSTVVRIHQDHTLAMSTTTSTPLTTKQPRIAIIGGGPGGLVLLLTLLRRGISATLYEREADYNSRAHLGGMLDLEYDSGQRALRENGLEDAFKKHGRRDAEAMKMTDKHGAPFFEKAGGDPSDDNLKGARPEIDRRVLRQILLDALPDKTAIKWGHGLASIRALGDGTHSLTFSNGLLVTTDIVVGADGARSRVRPLLSSAPLEYLGLAGVEISLAPPIAALPENADIRAGVGRGSCYAVQDGRMLGFQLNGDGRIRAYAWHAGPVDWALPADPAAAKRALLALYDGWAPWMRRLIELADEDAIFPRTLFQLPAGHRWAHTPGVTLLGDAAHLMGPFGTGANLAMMEGLDLGLVFAEAIGKGASVEERETAVAEWEEKMFPVAAKFAEQGAQGMQWIMNPQSPEELAQGYKDLVAEPYA
ncbi:monooxygenase FAD-binding protein [Trametes maxima]|nr:monooxygenase FAD-binding protein [Trametes maxima]